MANTPATTALAKLAIEFEILNCTYDRDIADLALHTAAELGVNPSQLLKTLMVDTPDGSIIALVPACKQLNLKKLAEAAGVKRCNIMKPQYAERTSGCFTGGISPFGQKKTLPTFIDLSVRDDTHVICSAGKRGVQLRLMPIDLSHACGSRFAPIT